MKNFLLCIGAFLLTFSCYAQSENEQTVPKRWLRVHVASGVNFIRNEALQNSYSTKSLFYWGIGARVGNPRKPEIFAQLDYSFSNYHREQMVDQTLQDSLLRINMLVPSLSFELIKFSSASIRAKVGYIAAFLKDDMNQINKLSPGFKIGIGMERKIFRSQTVHLDLDYDLIKARGAIYKDYDMWKLSFGVYLQPVYKKGRLSRSFNLW